MSSPDKGNGHARPHSSREFPRRLFRSKGQRARRAVGRVCGTYTAQAAGWPIMTQATSPAVVITAILRTSPS